MFLVKLVGNHSANTPRNLPRNFKKGSTEENIPRFPWGRPAQPSVPVLGPRGIVRCIPPVPDRGFRKPAAAIRDRRPVKAPPPRARPVSSLPRSYDRSPLVPLYSNSGMKRDYGLPEELHPRCRAAPVDYGRAPPDRRMPYRDDYPPPPEEESAYKKMEEELIMSQSQDKEFVLFAPPPRMVNGRWIHYPAIAYPNEECGFEFGREESPPCEVQLPPEDIVYKYQSTSVQLSLLKKVDLNLKGRKLRHRVKGGNYVTGNLVAYVAVSMTGVVVPFDGPAHLIKKLGRILKLFVDAACGIVLNAALTPLERRYSRTRCRFSSEHPFIFC
ncbi:hypothetical protein CASFOL_014065 [Castilleja foliolosa]|uniref:Uncharacterized protein n=1 Tax=Castilleja foliolosa TaxID=1961234 RepID=A0ABD3DLU5_9LAMI